MQDIIKRYQFISDCEGPTCLNDNAFELAQHFIPDGDELFAKLSAYDDYLVYVEKKENYKAGDTLRLILPFLKAFGATNNAIKDISIKNFNLVADAKKSLNYIKHIMETFMITTSYEQFAYPLYEFISIPRENVYCTHLDIDSYEFSLAETNTIKEFTNEILSLPDIKLFHTNNGQGLSSDTLRTVKRLNEMFWQEMKGMESYKILTNTNVMGGKEKANAIKKCVERTGIDLSRTIFVGDSITDVEAFELVKNNGGLSISFNGNSFAINAAEVACISNTVLVTFILTFVFNSGGKKELFDLINQWNIDGLKKHKINDNEIYNLFDNKLKKPIVKIITSSNKDKLIEESCSMRKSLRGELIGALG